MCRNASWGKQCHGWDEWSCFPSSYWNLAVQLRRFWSIGYYCVSKLNCTKPHWTSCHPIPFYWFHFSSEFFLLFFSILFLLLLSLFHILPRFQHLRKYNFGKFYLFSVSHRGKIHLIWISNILSFLKKWARAGRRNRVRI